MFKETSNTCVATLTDMCTFAFDGFYFCDRASEIIYTAVAGGFNIIFMIATSVAGNLENSVLLFV